MWGNILRAVVASLALQLLFTASLAQAQNDDLAKLLAAMAAGKSPISDAELAQRIAAADKEPLGTKGNPVRVDGPGGERGYLARLRCADGQRPGFERFGSLGPGHYGSIVDGYTVDCGAAAPGKVEVIIDMYHRGYVEDRPLPGFTIAAR